MPNVENQLGTVMEVDAAFKAGRISLRPMECLSWLQVGARSGALTAVAATAPVFSFRNASANPVIVRRIGVGFIATTGFTAAQELAWGLHVARAFTVADSAGNAIALTGNNCKTRTSLTTITSVDCRIANAGTLTAGTKTLDGNSLALQGAFAPAAGVGTLLAPSQNNLLSHDAGDYPLVLAQNEGFNILNMLLMGAGGVGTLYVNMELAEAASY